MRRPSGNAPARLLRVSPLFPAALFGIWLLFSGKLQVFHLSVGVVFVALATWMTIRIVPPHEAARPRMRILGTLWYMGWLAVQMVASAIYVMRVIISPKQHLNPRMVELHSPQPSILSRVILANSITLTPGTLTVDIDGDVFVVHALTERTARDLLSGDMGRRVAALSKAPKPITGAQPPPGGDAEDPAAPPQEEGITR